MLASRREVYRVRDSATALTATSTHSWSSGPRGSPPKGARFLRWSSMQDRPASIFEGNPENKIARFRCPKHQNLAISKQPAARIATLTQSLSRSSRTT
jgi:hypothetical protein